MALEINSLNSTSPYSPKDISLLNPTSVEAIFNPGVDYIEYVIQSNNNSFIRVDYNYNRYRFPVNGTVISNNISSIEIDPISDLTNSGFNSGEYITTYNFYKNQLQTSYNNKNLFIKEISADRTELKLDFLSFPITLIDDLEIFKQTINNNSIYFEEFYLNFGDNNLTVANNFNYDPTTYEIIVNLFSPLPNNITTNTSLWIVTKIADSLVFSISSTPDPVTPTVLSFPLKGPNLNINVNDQINNSTDYQTYNSLITSSLLSTSYNQLNNLISSSGIEINIDYTDFANFINFSSAVRRIKNFAYKVTQISSSQAEINNTISSFSGYDTSSNISILTDNINNIISNFDSYEYYLYYESSSYAWPKSNSTIPYTLYSPTSTEVTDWLGNEDPYNANYGGILSSASVYDNNNPDYLVKSIPDYLRDDPQNEPYKLFIELIGQHFDNIWIYYKDVTNLYQADNRLDYGISKDLVSQALQSFGIKLYQNNFSSNDLYSSFLGYGALNPEMTGSLPVTTGSFQEWINNYVTASYDASVTPLDDYNKEIYKRIYHNLPYLAKTKGTIPGLRALINCFGVPDTVLRISEFGGRDKDTSTYDYFDQQFNYAYRAYDPDVDQGNKIDTNFVLTSSWDPTGASSARPNSFQLRIKPRVPSNYSIEPEQYIFEISGSSGGYFADLTLTYTGSGLTTGSYSGSAVDPYYQYGTLTFDSKGSGNDTASLYLPFFNGDWWSIMINRSGSIGSSTFTIYAGNKLYYDGYDGNQIGYLASASLTGSAGGWEGTNVFFFPTSGISGSAYSSYRTYQGDIQELRYWNTTQSINSFKNYIMDPMSIDADGENAYSNQLAFRAPLGTTLITGSGFLTSIHPKVTGSWVTTQSFSNGTSTYYLGRNEYNTNVEARFLNSPVIGLKGRVTDKIQIVSSSLPTGSVLSQYISIEQNYPASGSESPDVNMLEVAFSPQNEINDDIINSLGYFNIGEYIGDPRQISSSATSYPDLDALSNNFFQKYFDTYDLKDYVRLIKYFDNSLFKMIKDFVPARTSLTSGVVIKQHILERNKYPQPQVEWEDLDYSGSIDTAFISGSTGGVFNPYNTTTFAQDWIQDYTSSIGVSYISHSSQDEFYNGELPGTEYIVTNGELNSDNDFKYPTTLQIYYDPTLYLSSITPLSDFLDINTSPNQGEIYLWYDTGSILQPSGPPIQR